MNAMKMLAVGFCAFALVVACAFAAEPMHDQHGEHAAKTASGGASGGASGVTSMDVYADRGRVHLLIAETIEGKPAALRYLRSEDCGETWSRAKNPGEGQPGPEIAHRGMDVQIAAAGDRLLAAWTTEGAQDRFGRGPISTAVSADRGTTWRAGPNPADDGQPTGHAFIDLAADAQGVFHIVWLDGRGGEGKGLVYARSADGGATWSRNIVLDPQTCECCWNTIVTAPGRDIGGERGGGGGHVFVLYRDASPRDMAIVRSDDAGRTWSKPITVGAFGWEISACPHVGGGLTIEPDDENGALALDAVVWTGKADARGAYRLRSSDGGATWSAPQRLGSVDSWHADLASDAAGNFTAVWDAFAEGRTAIFSSRSRDRGQSWSEPVRLTAPEISASHPRVISTPRGLRAFWTEHQFKDGTALATRWVTRRLD